MVEVRKLPALFAILQAFGTAQAQNTSVPTIIVDNDPSNALDIAAWALIYTYPLSIFANWIGGVFQHVGTNAIYHQRELASPDNPGVVKPNVDTLYSRVVLDLSSQDVVLTIPEIASGRYWNYPFYDPFGNVIAEIGIVRGNAAGNYLIRRADDVFAAPGYDNSSVGQDALYGPEGLNGVQQALSYHDTGFQHFQGIVNLPGTYATMLIRLEVIHNTTDELNTLHQYQNASNLTPINRTSTVQSTNIAPALQSLALNGTFLGVQTPQQQFELAARLVQYNQPLIYSQRYRIASILTRAGLYGGHYYPTDVNLTQAASIANATINAEVLDPLRVRPQGNDWYLQKPQHQGNFSTAYSETAYVALGGYQQQSVLQTLYPGFRGLGFSSTWHLQPNQSWLFTFSRKPVLISPGFWSLSVYGSDQYLIPNPINRFEVGDRTYNLTYETGGYVYGPQANASKDGPFQILVQPANLVPPKNWTNNWLPADTTFSMLLRWYVPATNMTDGSYVYPKVENISAILG